MGIKWRLHWSVVWSAFLGSSGVSAGGWACCWLVILLTSTVVVSSQELLIDIHFLVKIFWWDNIFLFLIYRCFFDLEHATSDGLEGFPSLGLVVKNVVEFHFVVFWGYCWHLGCYIGDINSFVVERLSTLLVDHFELFLI